MINIICTFLVYSKLIGCLTFFYIYGSSDVYVGDVYVVMLAEEITAAFRRFGPLVVDWPHKAESKSYFPPKGKHAAPKVLSSLLYR